MVWLKNPAESKSKVGQRVFYDMKPNGANSWAGQAFKPEDGKTYSGKMTLSGNSLTTAGCVAGGWICRSVSWSTRELIFARRSWPARSAIRVFLKTSNRG